MKKSVNPINTPKNKQIRADLRCCPLKSEKTLSQNIIKQKRNAQSENKTNIHKSHDAVLKMQEMSVTEKEKATDLKKQTIKMMIGSLKRMEQYDKRRGRNMQINKPTIDTG